MKDEALKLALEALFTYEEEWPDDGQGGLNFQVAYDQNKVFAAITAIKQARALDKKAEEHMIYRTFEQWKSGNVLEHGVPRTEYYSEDQLDLVEMGWKYGYDAGRAVEQALDKKAENARELGLDYEPVLKDNSNYRYDPPVAEPVQSCYCPNCEAMGKELAALKAQPAPVQEMTNIQRHEQNVQKFLAAQPAVPDAFGTREGEHPRYIEGWNDCRAKMLKEMKP
jgi:hypothetical protein